MRSVLIYREEKDGGFLVELNVRHGTTFHYENPLGPEPALQRNITNRIILLIEAQYPLRLDAGILKKKICSIGILGVRTKKPIITGRLIWGLDLSGGETTPNSPLHIVPKFIY